MKNKTKKDTRKHSWQFYVGIFCLIGCIAMLSENVIASLVYAIIAFLLLRKDWQLNQIKTAAESKPFCTGNGSNAQETNTATSIASKIEPRSDIKASPAKQSISSPDEPKIPQNQGNTPPEKKDTKPKIVADFATKTYRVNNVEHYIDNLLELAFPNSNYEMTKREIIEFGMTDQRIWENEFYPSKLELQPEPDNMYDPNAIKVLIDDQLVGYIKDGSCKHLLNVLNNDRFLGASCEITGGKYKKVEEDYDYDRDKETYDLITGETKYSIVLTVKEKNP